jgi:hypothetical protein
MNIDEIRNLQFSKKLRINELKAMTYAFKGKNILKSVNIKIWPPIEISIPFLIPNFSILSVKKQVKILIGIATKFWIVLIVLREKPFLIS